MVFGCVIKDYTSSRLGLQSVDYTLYFAGGRTRPAAEHMAAPTQQSAIDEERCHFPFGVRFFKCGMPVERLIAAIVRLK